jgi:hypothetical protein
VQEGGQLSGAQCDWVGGWFCDAQSSAESPEAPMTRIREDRNLAHSGSGGGGGCGGVSE